MHKPIWGSVFLFQGVDHLEVHGQGDVVRQTAAGMVRMRGHAAAKILKGGSHAGQIYRYPRLFWWCDVSTALAAVLVPHRGGVASVVSGPVRGGAQCDDRAGAAFRLCDEHQQQHGLGHRHGLQHGDGHDPGGELSFGVAVTPDGAFVYVTNQNSDTVSVIDTASNTVTDTIPVGAQPFGVAVTPDGAFVYVANNGSTTVSVIDTASNTVTATIPVGISPIAFGQFIGPASTPAAADLSLTKTDAPDPVSVGANLTYTLTVSNAGPSAADAVLDDPLSANTTFQSLSAPAGWSCTTPAVGSTGTVNCDTASLAAGATVSFTLVVQVSGAAGGTTLSNTATTSSATADPNTANNTDTETTTVTTPSQAIKLMVSVTGQGTVTSIPAGINCRPTCSATYNSGTPVDLTATAAAGYRFTGWTGACTGTVNPCTVTMNSDLSVKATFKK
jgi:uncharacterized repeat protein (TIGR01451 family)/uncharacterized repeat protein (TIGR02543 family)